MISALAEARRHGPGVRVRPREEQPQPHQGVPRLHRRQGVPARHGQGVRERTQEVSLIANCIFALTQFFITDLKDS